MYVFNPFEPPYGLLSIYAVVPFSVSGEQYRSVAEFVFLKVSRLPSKEEKMKEISLNPATFVDRLAQEELDFWHEEMRKNLFKVVDVLISQVKDFKKYKGIKFSFPNDSRLASYLTYKVNQQKVPMMLVKRIIDGVRKHLSAKYFNDIPGNPTLFELEKYATNLTSNVKDDDPALEHLDHLADFLKYELKKRNSFEEYKRNLSQFKQTLFNTLMDVALKTTDLPSEARHLARRQQLSQKTVGEIDNEVEETYKRYLKGEMPKAVMERLTVSLPINPVTSYSPPPDRIVELTDEHELSPYNSRNFVMGFKTYKTPMHFVIGELTTKIGYKGDDISTVPKPQLVTFFDEYVARNLWNIEKKYLTIGMKTTFKQHPVLGHLLKTTGSEIIQFNSSNDLLGIGDDSSGENFVGRMLESLRDEEYPNDKTYASAFDNVFYREWLTTRLQDEFTVMSLFKILNVDQLLELYKFPKAKESVRPVRDLYVIKQLFPTVTEDMINTAYSLIYPQMIAMDQLTDKDLTEYVVMAQKTYLEDDVPNDVATVVMKFFAEFFTKYRDNLKDQSEFGFAAKVLSSNDHSTADSIDSVFSVAKRRRVAYWYRFLTRGGN